MTEKEFAKVKWYKGIHVVTDMKDKGMPNLFEVILVNFQYNYVEIKHPCFRDSVRLYCKHIYMP